MDPRKRPFRCFLSANWTKLHSLKDQMTETSFKMISWCLSKENGLIPILHQNLVRFHDLIVYSFSFGLFPFQEGKNGRLFWLIFEIRCSSTQKQLWSKCNKQDQNLLKELGPLIRWIVSAINFCLSNGLYNKQENQILKEDPDGGSEGFHVKNS